jgi:methyl-accepting chemotaxis protein
MKTAHLRIGTKLALAFAAQIALLAATAAYGLNRMDLMQSNLDEITRINQREAALASSMQVALAERMVALRNAVLLSKDSDIAAEIRQLDLADKTYSAQQARLQNLLAQSSASEEELQALRDADNAASGAESLIEDIISAAQRHADSKATALIVTQLAPVQARWNAALSRLAQMQTQQNDVVVEGSKAAAAHARLMMGVLAGLSVLGGILLAWAITRSIAHPISVLLGSVMSDAARWRQDEATLPGKGMEP